MYAYEIIFCLSEKYIEKERLIVTIEKVTEAEALNKLYYPSVPVLSGGVAFFNVSISALK